MPFDREQLRGPDETIIQKLYKLVTGLADTEHEAVLEVKTELEEEFPWLA